MSNDQDTVPTVSTNDPEGPPASILPGFPDFDLTECVVQRGAHMSVAGGNSDVMTGYIDHKHLHRRTLCTKGGKVKVAIKRLRADLSKDTKLIKSLRREISIWLKLDHPNILPFLGFMLENNFPSLISEWMVRGTARQFAKNNPDCDMVHLFGGIADGLQYMHTQEFIHSDLKAENVLISPLGEPLICDFGISRMLDPSHSNFVSSTHDGQPRGTTRWMAVELFFSKETPDPKHSKETDVWAYGMTIYELASRSLPYAHLKQDPQVIIAIVKGELPDLSASCFSLSPGAYATFRTICNGCWNPDPSKRLTMMQITSFLADTVGSEDLGAEAASERSRGRSESRSIAPGVPETAPQEASQLQLVPRVSLPKASIAAGIDAEAPLHLTHDDRRSQTNSSFKTETRRLAVNVDTKESYSIIEGSLRETPLDVSPGTATVDGPSFPMLRNGHAPLHQLFFIGTQHVTMGSESARSQDRSPFNYSCIRTPPAPGKQIYIADLPSLNAAGSLPQQRQVLQSIRHRSAQSIPSVCAPSDDEEAISKGASIFEIQSEKTRNWPSDLGLPLLAFERFAIMLQDWWKQSGVNFNPKTVTIGNRQVDMKQLYDLYTAVQEIGGVANVQRHDLWSIVATKVDWTAAASAESGRTQDQIADQIRTVYESLLESFEQVFMSSTVKQYSTSLSKPLGNQVASDQPSSCSAFPPLRSPSRQDTSLQEWQGESPTASASESESQQFPVSAGSINGFPQSQGFPNEILQRALRNTDGRPLTLEELRIKAAQLRRVIDAERRLLENTPKPTTQETLRAFREKQREIQTREFIFAKIAEHVRMMGSQQGAPPSQQPGPPNATDAPGGSAMNAIGFPNPSQPQPGQQQPQSSQNWMTQMNNINMPNQPSGALPTNQQMHNGATQNGPAQTPQQHTGSPFPGNIGQSQQQQTPIPRSGPTPQQQMLQAFLQQQHQQQQQNGNQSSPPSSAPGALPGQSRFGQQGPGLEVQDAQHRSNSLSFPPLARDKFLAMLQEWWKRSGITFDPRMLTIGNRQIDTNQLHQLHTEVLQLGGVVNVERHGLWNVVAAKMGLKSPAINESGHTQDQIAEQIRVVYDRLLQSFEQTYMAAAMKMKSSLTAPPYQQQQQQQPPLEHQIAPNLLGSASGQPSSQLSIQQALQMIKLANMSAEQLRANGYPENLIQNIEKSRPSLEATWRRMQLQRAQAGQLQQLRTSREDANETRETLIRSRL